MRLQSGKAGEMAAERYFLNNGWKMIRTQPEIQILGVAPGRRFGTVFTCRMIGRGGTPDYMGYDANSQKHEYRACEVKECTGASMPASRLDREQRAFLSALPANTAWVGILWTDTQKFSIHPFIKKGSYKRP